MHHKHNFLTHVVSNKARLQCMPNLSLIILAKFCAHQHDPLCFPWPTYTWTKHWNTLNRGACSKHAKLDDKHECNGVNKSNSRNGFKKMEMRGDLPVCAWGWRSLDCSWPMGVGGHHAPPARPGALQMQNLPANRPPCHEHRVTNRKTAQAQHLTLISGLSKFKHWQMNSRRKSDKRWDDRRKRWNGPS